MQNFIEELAKYGLTQETYEAACNDIDMKQDGSVDLDWSEITQKHGIKLNPDSVRKANGTPFGGTFRTAYFKNKSISSSITDTEKAKSAYKSEQSINKDGTYTSNKLISITQDELKNPVSLLEAHGFDIKDWELVSARNNIWNVYSKQDGIQELYSSKIVVKPKEQTIDYDRINEWFNKLDRTYSLPALKTSDGYLNGNKCLLIDIADLHLNLQATMFSTGN